ncbi:N alpha-acetyl-transferase [Pichia californica]|nr:N alpha-acetyl-transferase [[Candida] californica]
MLEEGLVYVLFRLLDSDKLLGFMSMKLINERSLQVLYLYEIQLDEHYRNMKLGSFLMKKLEVIVKSINKEGKLKKLWYKTYKDEYHDSNDSNLILTGVALTVFSVNKKARGLYNRLGYTLHRDSEIEKVLRNGKIIEPDYYMLEKVVN